MSPVPRRRARPLLETWERGTAGAVPRDWVPHVGTNLGEGSRAAAVVTGGGGGVETTERAEAHEPRLDADARCRGNGRAQARDVSEAARGRHVGKRRPVRT